MSWSWNPFAWLIRWLFGDSRKSEPVVQPTSEVDPSVSKGPEAPATEVDGVQEWEAVIVDEGTDGDPVGDADVGADDAVVQVSKAVAEPSDQVDTASDVGDDSTKETVFINEPVFKARNKNFSPMVDWQHLDYRVHRDGERNSKCVILARKDYRLKVYGTKSEIDGCTVLVKVNDVGFEGRLQHVGGEEHVVYMSEGDWMKLAGENNDE